MKNNEYTVSSSQVRERLGITIYIVSGIFLAIILCIALIIVDEKTSSKQLYICFPICMFIFYVISMIYKKLNGIDTSYNHLKNSEISIYPVVSLMFLKYISYRYIRISIFLIMISITFSVSLYLFSQETFILPTNIIIFSLSILLTLRLKLIENRIMSGFFGNNKDEANELIQFILAHAERVDFTDGDGRPKKCFLPEELLSFESFSPAEEVRL